MFTAESVNERILKIGQHLPKLLAIKYRVVFYDLCCYRYYLSAVQFTDVQFCVMMLTDLTSR